MKELTEKQEMIEKLQKQREEQLKRQEAEVREKLQKELKDKEMMLQQTLNE